MTYLRAAAIRGACYLAFWIVLIGTGVGDLVAGIFTAVAGHLGQPAPDAARCRPRALDRAGAARRELPVAVGGRGVGCRAPRARPAPAARTRLRRIPLRLRARTARNAFASLTSLMPGTVPLADDGQDAPLPLPRREPAGRRGAGPRPRPWSRARSTPGRGDDDLPPRGVGFRAAHHCARTQAAAARTRRRGPHHGRAAARHRRHRGAAALRRRHRAFAAIDVALTLALLAAFVSIAFAKAARRTDREADTATPADQG